MIIKIENKTTEDIDVDSNSFLVLEASTNKVYFDEDDSTTYELGYYIVKYGYTNLAKLIDSDSIAIYSGDDELTPKETFLLFRDTYNKRIFNNTRIKFDENNCGNMYFSLTGNDLRIFNPISKKWYSAQLTEIVE